MEGEKISFSRNKSSNLVTESYILLPCLVCGTDLGPEVDSIVKHEVDCNSDDDQLIDHCYQASFTNLNDTTFKNDKTDESGIGGGGSNDVDGDVIFHWFLKWFKVDFDVKKRKSKSTKRRFRKSDGEGREDEKLSFCGACRSQLADLLDLQLKLDALGREVENGVRKFKEKIQSSEVDFKKKGIYDRNPRYKSLRSKIIKSSGGERLSSTILAAVHVEAQKNSDGGRKSRRTKRPISRFISGQEDTRPYDVLPVVMVSPIDKAIAEEHLLKIEDDFSKSSVPVQLIEAPVSPKIVKKRRISNKIKNFKSRRVPTKTVKKAKRPPQSKNVKAHRPSNLISLKKTAPPTEIKEEADKDWTPESPPAQNLDNLNNETDSNDDWKDLKSHPVPPPHKKQKLKKNRSTDIPEKKLVNEPPENGDEDNQEDSNNRIYRRFSEDPQNKTLSYGEFAFKLIDPQEDGEESQLQCISCSLVIPNKKGWVRSHVTKVHTNRFTCPHCPARFSKITNMRYHVQGVHMGKRVQQKKVICDICGLPMSGAIKAHKWTHKSKEEKEEALANNSADVPDHFQERFQCDECGQSFHFKYNLQKHIERQHEGKPKEKELCPECGGAYKELQAHIKYAHTKTEEQRTWECTEPGCGKKFKRISQLNRHKNHAHLKLRPFKCTLCPRSFETQGVLKRHLDSHLGIRPFKCDSCPSAFTTRSAVNTHRRIFHEEGSKPKRKSYVRGPCMLEVGVTQEELRKKKMYYPPSLVRGAAGAGSRLPGSTTSHDSTTGYDYEYEDQGKREVD